VTLAFFLDDFDFAQFEAMSELLLKEFGPNDRLLSPVYTSWLYENNPYGRAKIVTATNGKNWVGFMALIPVALMSRFQVRAAYYVVNVLVDPLERGKNVFGSMIQIAQSHVRSEGAILMGHPNAAAIGAWRRAGMRFLSPLAAHIIAPLPSLGKVRTRPLKRNELGELVNLIDKDLRVRGDMNVILTEDYVDWRFFRHPTNAYQLRTVIIDGEPAGFWVVRKLRTGMHLLVDLFVTETHAAAALASCPILTFAFTGAEAAGCPLWRSPIRKELPFFCTDDRSALGTLDGTRLGLTTSDL
jgi:hypothetical protein